MASNALTLNVKTMTGEYIPVELDRNSKWPTYEIKHLIEKVDHNLPYYYQTILHIDPATGEPYPTRAPYREDSILLLLMSAPDVYIKKQEIYHHTLPGSDQKIQSTRYSVHVYHEKQQRDMFSFLVNSMGFHLFTREQAHGSKPWSTHIDGKHLNYSSTIEEAVAPLPEMIRDEVIRKWNSKEVIHTQDRLPYTKHRRYSMSHNGDDSDDE